MCPAGGSIFHTLCLLYLDCVRHLKQEVGDAAFVVWVSDLRNWFESGEVHWNLLFHFFFNYSCSPSIIPPGNLHIFAEKWSLSDLLPSINFLARRNCSSVFWSDGGPSRKRTISITWKKLVIAFNRLKFLKLWSCHFENVFSQLPSWRAVRFWFWREVNDGDQLMSVDYINWCL